MAGLHGLVELQDAGALGTASEGLEVQAIAGHEVILAALFDTKFMAWGGRDGRDALLFGHEVFAGHGGDGCEGRGLTARRAARGTGSLYLMHIGFGGEGPICCC